MRAQRGRAVAAGLSDADVDRAGDALARAGFSLAGRASDGAKALALVREAQPDLLLADAILPGIDGAALAERIRGLPLNVQPAILIARLPGCALPGEDRLEALGAAAIDKPPEAGAILSALAKLEDRGPAMPAALAARLEALLDALGVPEHPGRECLRRGVALAWADRRRLYPLKARLYPQIARLTGRDPAQAERAMRYAIDAAWRSGDIAQQHKIFGDTIDARRGRPTCGEMVAQLAEKLRWEGRL